MKNLYIIAILLPFVFTSCSVFEPKKEETADELYEIGMEEFNDGSYRVAIETFWKLKDWYPFSKHAVTAELRIADGFFNLKLFDRAIWAYRSFESLHPGNEHIPYVINQIGLSHFGDVDTPDRDQTSAKKALESFERLLKLYPDSPYAEKAKENMLISQNSLANHEFTVGEFYYKKKHYSAALRRFKRIIDNYPDTVDIRDQALQYITLSEEAMRYEEASP